MEIIREHCCQCGTYLPDEKSGYKYMGGIYCKDCLVNMLITDYVVEEIDYESLKM